MSRGFGKRSSRSRKRNNTPADLDITSFMNLMIVLVPVLLLNMVFTHIRVLELQLPELQDQLTDNQDKTEKQLELIIREDTIKLYYPAGSLLKSFPKKSGEYDFAGIQNYLKQVKSTFQQQQMAKKDIVILPESKVPYQVLVATIDTVKSYPTVVATSVVNAELFPDVSLGDAPKANRISRQAHVEQTIERKTQKPEVNSDILLSSVNSGISKNRGGQ